MPPAPLPPARVSRREALRLGALLTSGVALVSCTNSSDDNQQAGAGSAENRAVFRFAQGAPVTSLDPALQPVTSTTRVTAQVLETLVAANHYTGEPEASLATEWQISEDRKTYTFTLRQDVQFSDGTDFNAAAVLRNAERWKSLATDTATMHLCVPYQPLYGWGFGVMQTPSQQAKSPAATGLATPAAEPQASASATPTTETGKTSNGKDPNGKDTGQTAVENPHSQPLLASIEERDGKIVMTLSRPSLAFLRMLTQPAFGILAPSCLGDNSQLKDKLVGTGAFKVQSNEQARTVLVRNEHYKRENSSKIALGEIQFLTLSSSDKRYYSLVADKIDACDQVSPNDLAPLVREGYLIHTRDPFSLVYFNFNVAHPALKNVAVRRAIARAVDRGSINQYYLQGTSEALGFLPAMFRTQDEELLKPYYRRDLDAAKSLLAAANYQNEAIECYYPVDVSLPWMSTPQVVYSQLVGSLIEAGLNIKPVPLGWADYCQKVHGTGAERGIVLGGFYGAYRDPYAFLATVLSPLLVSRWVAEQKVDTHADPSASAHPTDTAHPSESAQPSQSAVASASASPSTSPTAKPARIDPAPTLEQIMQEIREADSAETVDDQRSKYRQVSALLAQFMPGVPLLNVTSNVAMSRDVRDYVTEQNAVEYFALLRVD